MIRISPWDILFYILIRWGRLRFQIIIITGRLFTVLIKFFSEFSITYCFFRLSISVKNSQIIGLLENFLVHNRSNNPYNSSGIPCLSEFASSENDIESTFPFFMICSQSSFEKTGESPTSEKVSMSSLVEDSSVEYPLRAPTILEVKSLRLFRLESSPGLEMKLNWLSWLPSLFCIFL